MWVSNMKLRCTVSLDRIERALSLQDTYRHAGVISLSMRAYCIEGSESDFS